MEFSELEVLSFLISAGQVFIKSRKLEDPYTDLGFVFQRDILLDWRTVLENVMPIKRVGYRALCAFGS